MEASDKSFRVLPDSRVSSKAEANRWQQSAVESFFANMLLRVTATVYAVHVKGTLSRRVFSWRFYGRKFFPVLRMFYRKNDVGIILSPMVFITKSTVNFAILLAINVGVAND